MLPFTFLTAEEDIFNEEPPLDVLEEEYDEYGGLSSQYCASSFSRPAYLSNY